MGIAGDATGEDPMFLSIAQAPDDVGRPPEAAMPMSTSPAGDMVFCEDLSRPLLGRSRLRKFHRLPDGLVAAGDQY